MKTLSPIFAALLLCSLASPLALAGDLSSHPKLRPNQDCQECHDTSYIKSHSSHQNDKVKVECMQCHAGTTAETKFQPQSPPPSANCSPCHGIIHKGDAPLTLPEDYKDPHKYWLTKAEGVIFSGQKMSDSALNLENKQSLNMPWDIHAARGLECASCHRTANHPLAQKGNELVKQDPRGFRIGMYLTQPNHRLTKPECTDCHDAQSTIKQHNDFPYKARHLSKVACTTCHVSSLHTPEYSPTNTGDNTDFIPARDPLLVGQTKLVAKNGPKGHTINHGVMRGEHVLRDCAECHGNSALATGTLYILGSDRLRWIDWLGILLVLGSLVGVSAHALLRLQAQEGTKPTIRPTRRVYMYSLYERLWHWTSAIGIILLMCTGFQIHFMGAHSWLGFSKIVTLHNVLAAIVIINAALSLFYHLASNEIRQFLPPMRSFLTDSLAQFRYYTHGIFKGEPHPLQKSPEHKMNPIQQMTYLALLNLLLPAQVLTGIMMYFGDHYPQYMDWAGGLKVIAPMHTLLAWCFVQFLVVHIYMTTTGHKIFTNIRAMITGYDEIEE